MITSQIKSIFCCLYKPISQAINDSCRSQPCVGLADYILPLSSCSVIDLKRRPRRRKFPEEQKEEDDFADDGDEDMNFLHQFMLIAMDSPMAKSGSLQLYIHTTKNQVIEINPSFRVPRTIGVFKKVIGKLFAEASGRVSALDGTVLLKIIGKSAWNEVLSSLPRKISLHNQAKRVCQQSDIIGKDGGKYKDALFEICASNDKKGILFEEEVVRPNELQISPTITINRLLNLLEDLEKIEIKAIQTQQTPAEEDKD